MNSLNDVMIKEIAAVKELLSALDKQHGYILKNDIFSLEKIVSDIQLINKKVAQIEMERRQITRGQSMRKIIYDLKDEETENNYRKMKILLQEVKVQNNSNNLLIKQNLSFTNRMLEVLNPNRQTKVYNSYGKFKR